MLTPLLAASSPCCQIDRFDCGGCRPDDRSLSEGCLWRSPPSGQAQVSDPVHFSCIEELTPISRCLYALPAGIGYVLRLPVSSRSAISLVAAPRKSPAPRLHLRRPPRGSRASSPDKDRPAEPDQVQKTRATGLDRGTASAL